MMNYSMLERLIRAEMNEENNEKLEISSCNARPVTLYDTVMTTTQATAQ